LVEYIYGISACIIGLLDVVGVLYIIYLALPRTTGMPLTIILNIINAGRGGGVI
jgi:hypothetical protein